MGKPQLTVCKRHDVNCKKYAESMAYTKRMAYNQNVFKNHDVQPEFVMCSLENYLTGYSFYVFKELFERVLCHSILELMYSFRRVFQNIYNLMLGKDNK